ncbi:MAG: hypothetical protein HRT44_07310 [Bdellovibrionales bacterium]|nr:hypothetical protein [Bdellovibrionales bacterium]NQZ19045.1 hypothetical protein [Bdellovibrionales bacterium]
MGNKFIWLISLVFFATMSVSCKDTTKQSQKKVTKKNHKVTKAVIKHNHLSEKIKLKQPKKVLSNRNIKTELKKTEESTPVVARKDEPLEKMACIIPNGDGVKKWNQSKEAYGDCFVTSCQPGFIKYKSGCVPICQEDEAFFKGSCHPVFASCKVNGEPGTKIWDVDRYGSCVSDDDFAISAIE